MDLRYKFNHRGLNSLISHGLVGYYPLFDHDWINKMQTLSSKNLSVKDKRQVQKIINKIKNINGIEKKKTIFFSHTEEEQALFIKAFTDFIAGKKVDENRELH